MRAASFILCTAAAAGPADTTRAAGAEDSAADWREERAGTSYWLGGGVEMLAFYVFPTGGLATLEGALDVRLAKAVSFRLTQLLGFGGGVSDSGFFTVLPTLRASFRFYPAPYYSIWLGYSGRAGLAVALGDAREPVGVLPLHGPDLSLASFRFGARGEFELDHGGGAFLTPFWGYHSSVVLRYRFED